MNEVTEKNGLKLIITSAVFQDWRGRTIIRGDEPFLRLSIDHSESHSTQVGLIN